MVARRGRSTGFTTVIGSHEAHPAHIAIYPYWRHAIGLPRTAIGKFIDAEMPEIERRLNLWRLGDPLPTPERTQCKGFEMRHGVEWCEQ
jgi:hypothetical protein